MELTRWTIINQDFDKSSRFSKAEWCELIESRTVLGEVIDGVPHIDAAAFYSTVIFTPGGAGPEKPKAPTEKKGVDDAFSEPDLLGLPVIAILKTKKVNEIFNNSKNNARRRGIKWGLSKEDVLSLLERSKGLCEVTGIKLNHSTPKTKGDKRPFASSLDRKDSTLGYTKSNCRIVCAAANMAMNQWGDKVLKKMAISMVKTGKVKL